MDDHELTEMLRDAADELDVDDVPPMEAIAAGRRRARRARGALLAGCVAAVTMAVVLIATSLAGSPTAQDMRVGGATGTGGTSAGVPSTTSSPSTTTRRPAATTVPPVLTPDPSTELLDRFDGGNMKPVASGEADGIPWSLYLLDAQTPDGFSECIFMSVGSPGGSGGSTCNGAAKASPAPRRVSLSATATASTKPTSIAFGVVPSAGQYLWRPTRPLEATLVKAGSESGTAAPGGQLLKSRTIQTPYGERNIIVHAFTKRSTR